MRSKILLTIILATAIISPAYLFASNIANMDTARRLKSLQPFLGTYTDTNAIVSNITYLGADNNPELRKSAVVTQIAIEKTHDIPHFVVRHWVYGNITTTLSIPINAESSQDKEQFPFVFSKTHSGAIKFKTNYRSVIENVKNETFLVTIFGNKDLFIIDPYLLKGDNHFNGTQQRIDQLPWEITETHVTSLLELTGFLRFNLKDQASKNKVRLIDFINGKFNKDPNGSCAKIF